jgi:hypothetical protein
MCRKKGSDRQRLGEGGAIVTLEVRLRADVGPDEGVLTSSRSKFMGTGQNGVTKGGAKGGDARRARY